jgi:hypothetical protein
MSAATEAGTAVRRPRCLLGYPPSFYSFGSTLKLELERRGYEVVTVSDEYPANLFGRLLGQFRRPWLLRQITVRKYRSLLADQPPFDLCLMVKGRGMSEACVDFLRSICKRTVAFNFDSFNYHSSSLDWFRQFDQFATFDLKDAHEHGVPLVHLFSALPPLSAPSDKRIDVSAIVKNHSQRLHYIDTVLTALPRATRLIYIFEANVLSFFVNFLRYPRLYIKYWRYIHFKPLSYAQFMDALAASRVTIDYAHPAQTGITIRCFEAMSVGTHLITNNPNVGDCAWFEGVGVLHLPAGGSTAVLADGFAQLLKSPATVRLRSLADFVGDLLALPNTRAGSGRAEPIP